MVNEDWLLSVSQQSNKCNSLVADQTKYEAHPHTALTQRAAVRCRNLHGHRNDWISLRRQDCWGILNAEVLSSPWGLCWTERKSGTAEASLLGSSVPKALMFLQVGGRHWLGRPWVHMLFSHTPVQNRRKTQKVGYLGCVFLWRRGNTRDNCLLWSKSVLLIANWFFFLMT